MATQLNKEQMANLINMGMTIGMRIGVDRVRGNETIKDPKKVCIEIVEAYQLYNNTQDDSKLKALEQYLA